MNYSPEYPQDVERIQKILASEGHSVSKEDAEKLWSDHSYSSAAGWLILPDDDDDLLQTLKAQIRSSTGDEASNAFNNWIDGQYYDASNDDLREAFIAGWQASQYR